jgi:hypothetical protein
MKNCQVYNKILKILIPNYTKVYHLKSKLIIIKVKDIKEVEINSRKETPKNNIKTKRL